ncbi:m-AAA protease-interacting protein 1, mitochondrial [Zeugodacus cucurbitae]|uniref:m-AAA protease-interacting protein 1, mitochondrial n=1 Tax=Zeugodacus cucurbitae TaxID=28588 RepID=UPI0005968595|nr:m-AAA protease-interacting protein 1, mitochondrial [Zeugodacus cucurbitae]
MLRMISFRRILEAPLKPKELCNYRLLSPIHRFSSNIPNPDHSNFHLDGSRSLPRLMDFPETLWPSTINTLRNWILIQFIIRPYFDREFTIKDFVCGAKHALQIISTKLVNGEFDALNNFVSKEAISELKPTIQKLSVAQRKQLQINKTDIYFAFPYQVGIIFDEEEEKEQKRWVEITMVYHVLRGLTEMRNRGEEIPWNMGSLPEYQDKVFVCNYRFKKEFTNDNESDWTVNALNHFKPIDLVREK